MPEFCCDVCPHEVTCADKLEVAFARPEDIEEVSSESDS